MNKEARAVALLACPAGAALVLDVSANLADHPLMYFAQPRVSFKLAALAIGFVDQHGDAGLREAALREAQAHRDLARRIADSPAFDWWWEPFAPDIQTWASPQFPRGQERDPLQLFRPEEWVRPEPPDEHEDGLPHGTLRQVTSEFRDGTTSEWTAYAEGTCEHICQFPIAVWRVRFNTAPKVWEVRSPRDWHQLCRAYPHHAPDGRLVPDWLSVSQEWDGVHFALGAILTGDQARYDDSGEWSRMLHFHSEHTQWLNRLDVVGERMPDVEEQHNRLRVRAFDYGDQIHGGAGWFSLLPEE